MIARLIRTTIFVATVCISTASGALPEYDRVLVLQTPRPTSNAELTDHNGHPFQLNDLRGKVSLVFFGFTNCPDVCPATMAKLRQLEWSGLVDNRKVDYVLISVDGERDTPETMKKFLKSFSDGFIGLTGESSRVKKISREFRASFFKGAGEEDYNIAHSTQTFALDASGAVRAELHNASVQAMAGVVNALIAEVEGSEVN